ATGGPRVGEAVAALRRGGAQRVALASWLLAPGLFQRQLDACGADVVGAPLSDHDAVLDLVVDRYRSALAVGRRTA
ncbi:MAG: cobalamin biosynthesis protein CbiX, partial [Pseudonocardia sp.]|nr:cobalamin biosynthesis protein CbiX [Pseudonocardia sp.]